MENRVNKLRIIDCLIIINLQWFWREAEARSQFIAIGGEENVEKIFFPFDWPSHMNCVAWRIFRSFKFLSWEISRALLWHWTIL